MLLLLVAMLEKFIGSIDTQRAMGNSTLGAVFNDFPAKNFKSLLYFPIDFLSIFKDFNLRDGVSVHEIGERRLDR